VSKPSTAKPPIFFVMIRPFAPSTQRLRPSTVKYRAARRERGNKGSIRLRRAGAMSESFRSRAILPYFRTKGLMVTRYVARGTAFGVRQRRALKPIGPRF
jgi:hypothetical protein